MVSDCTQQSYFYAQFFKKIANSSAGFLTQPTLKLIILGLRVKVQRADG